MLEKFVYNRTNFVTGYVWFTIGTFIGSMALLVRPPWRTQIFSESGQSTPSNRFWYFVNRFTAGLGSFLIFYAISLTHPAIVNAISGVRYVVIFLGAFMLIAGVIVVGLAGGKAAAAGLTPLSRQPRIFSSG